MLKGVKKIDPNPPLKKVEPKPTFKKVDPKIATLLV